MRLVLTTISCICIIFCLNAQIDTTFKIADYARPDLERRTMNIFSFFALNNSFARMGDSVTFNNIGGRLSGNFNHTKFVNSARTQRTESFSLSSSNSFNTEDRYTKDITKRIHSYSGINYRGQIKQFDNQQNFWERRVILDIDHSFSAYNDIDSTDRIIRHSISPKITSAFYRGKGRIEFINDAWHAITILEMLEDQGLLKKAVDSTAIQNFAERISEIKNFRNTDIRLENIAEFEALCAHLVDNQLVDPEDYRFFAILRDAWVYESFTARHSGSEFKYGLIPNINLIPEYSRQLIDFSRLEASLHASIIYNKYHPINNDWQHDQSYQLNIGTIINRNLTELERASETINKDLLNGNFRARYSWRYLPSQRTNYAIGLTMRYDYNRAIGESINKNEESGILDCAISGNFNYYFSPKLFLDIDGGISLYSKHFNEDTNMFGNNNYLEARMNYLFR